MPTIEEITRHLNAGQMLTCEEGRYLLAVVKSYENCNCIVAAEAACEEPEEPTEIEDDGAL